MSSWIDRIGTEQTGRLAHVGRLGDAHEEQHYAPDDAYPQQPVGHRVAPCARQQIQQHAHRYGQESGTHQDLVLQMQLGCVYYPYYEFGHGAYTYHQPDYHINLIHAPYSPALIGFGFHSN